MDGDNDNGVKPLKRKPLKRVRLIRSRKQTTKYIVVKVSDIRKDIIVISDDESDHDSIGKRVRRRKRLKRLNKRIDKVDGGKTNVRWKSNDYNHYAGKELGYSLNDFVVSYRSKLL